MKNKLLITFSCLVSSIFYYTYWQQELTKAEIYIPNQIIVRYKDQSKTKNNTKNINELKLNSLKIKDKSEKDPNLVLLEINDGKNIEETISILKENPDIEYAEPNYIRYFFGMSDINTNDTYKNSQKSLELISWPETFNHYSWFLSNNSWILVWIIDNWINYNHPDLENSMRNQSNCIVDWENNYCEHWYDFFHNTSTPLPNSNDHWTHIAWIIAAEINNWKWIIWVNPYAKIVSLKVWNSETLTSYDEIRAIKFATDNWIKIINASFWSEFSSDIEKEAIEEFWESWGLFIAAAWNWDSNNIWLNIDSSWPMYPCSYNLDNIICVAATDNYWNLATYSNYWNSSVDIAAPWSSIYSTIISWSSLHNIFSEDFSNCTTWWETLNWRNTWSCYKRSNNSFWYSFKNEITSPSINLEESSGTQISISIVCNTLSNIQIEFSNNNSTYSWYENLWQFSSRRLTVEIPEDFNSEYFSFKLKILSWSSKQFCVIDDIDIFQDPYIQWNDDVYWRKSWTSMATPHVVWLASLIMMINPSLSYQDIKNIILEYGDSKPNLSGIIVSGKIINIKKSLDAASIKNISAPTWLDSNRSWNIMRNPTEWANTYYYEIYDINENFIYSWTTNNTWISTQLQWNYIRKVKWIDILWNESNFSNYYICEKPNYWIINLFTWECSSLSSISIPEDNCYNSYKIILSWYENNSISWEISNNKPWNITKTFYIENNFWEKTNNFDINYTRTDSLPTMNINKYTYPNTITSTNSQNIWNIINIFWLKDWECWTDSIIPISVSCTKGNAILSGKNLIITAPTSENWKSDCNIIFSDDEWNLTTWLFIYSFNTTQTNNWWWGGWWGWWGWGGWSNTKTEIIVENSTTTSWKIIPTTWSSSWSYEEDFSLEKPNTLKLFEESKENDTDKSRYQEWNQSERLPNWYTREFNNAYKFAYLNWITTMNNINKADMNWKLTRIAMAKMLSNYAINVLGKKPENTIVPKFWDVSEELNNNYWWAVDLAYQLWIMWIWINRFRPNDEVTRAEFWTALSRMLFWLKDGNPYYSTHLKKLKREWIISNDNPNLKELRWYVMIMLMRSSIK